ncbi:hypothetical protein C5167_039806 [Papaver somniferum]|uniref:PHD-type domain-containing protein n=1 Tax=Papaver somniferum TaxID=3469 RepID=A0A4Y7ID68_PAPSO|nr:uncharacterized protein LOC113311008 [Papaver somniferum]XP_026415633.1 uncharacterized protein LOC113311008 [Papaver somniferum]XP_026415640.1 uncharacterized protein LOC113311008 [Papaver somniferum]XP_026415648.1 uncharacterized protein LOC113311008 [Papaver somniferum]XP_026415655.1 uncharacterized protein LOC113311008 [Papaver somniferum]XP_026415661.1 uncharacterized protein LOC113311008 [Papaver somniferum]XP_026415668.1 uncharacterized protein LOC113311008 [Papaver somniferum]XP_0
MISSKVLLTYKRKRKLSHGTGYLKSCSKYPTNKLSPVPGNLVESGETWSCVKCACVDALEKRLLCDSCCETYHLQCLDPPLKRVPDGQWFCSTCVKQKESGVYQVQASRRVKPRLTNEESDFGLSTNSYLKVLQTVRPDETACEETDGSVRAGELPEKKSDNCFTGLPLHTDHVPECKSPLTGESSILQSVNVEAPKKSSTECLGMSGERDCTVEYTSASTLKPSGSDTADSPLKDSTDLCNSSATLKKKFSITFNRRYRNKKNETNIENPLVKVKECSVNKCCSNSACGPDGSFEDNSQQCSSATHLSTSLQLKDDKFVEQNRDAGSSSSIAARGVHKTKMHVEQDQSSQRCLSEDHSAIAALVPCLNSHPHLSSVRPEFDSGAQFSRKEFIAKTSTDETDSSVINEKVQELPKVVDLNEKQSQTIVNDCVKEAVMPNHVSENGVFLAPLDLTTSPIDLRCSETFLDSSISLDPNHVTDWYGGASKNVRGLLESTNNSVEEKLASQNLFVTRNTCDEIEEGVNNRHGKDSPMLSLGISLVDPCKKSCSDDEISHVDPPREPLDTTASLDSEEINSNVESGCGLNQTNTRATEPPLFPCSASLSSPSVPPINFFKDTPSIPSLPNSDILSGGCTLEMSLHSETASFLRRRQILDSITAKALRESQGCSLGQLKGDPKIWSEEELDFLWVGVRRHGKGNWDSILQDPRLRFSRFRDATDLAERWYLERLNLLNTTSHDINYDFLSRKRSIGSQCNSTYHAVGPTGTLTDETRLSLGDTYVQRQLNRFDVPGITQMLTSGGVSERMSSVGNSKLTHSVLQRIGTKQLHIPSRRQRKPSHSNANYGRQRYATGPSILHQNPYEKLGVRRGLFNSTRDGSLLREDMPSGIRESGTNLPHWLKEVVNMSSLRPYEAAFLPNEGSAGSESLNLKCNNYNRDAPLFPSREASMVSSPDPRQRLDEAGLQATASVPNNYHSSKSKRDPFSRLGSTSEIPESRNLISDYRSGPKFNCPVTYPVTKENDLIVIDSDASSEETLSDH